TSSNCFWYVSLDSSKSSAVLSLKRKSFVGSHADLISADTYLSRGSFRNLGSLKKAVLLRTVSVGHCQVWFRLKRPKRAVAFSGLKFSRFERVSGRMRAGLGNLWSGGRLSNASSSPLAYSSSRA